MRDELLLQEELDLAIQESIASSKEGFTIHLSLDKYYRVFGGIFSFLKEELHLICAKHDVYFNSNNMFDQIYHIKDKTYLSIAANAKAKYDNIKEEDRKEYINKYVNTEFYKTFIKIEFRKEVK